MGNKDNPRVVYNTASLSEKDFCFLKNKYKTMAKVIVPYIIPKRL